jgi:aryl-alcohol dehydrogenase-like predicted oxidoreductase
VTEAQLAVGTVQFGMAYGVAGAKRAVPEDEARRILEISAAAGARLLDTAPAYGDIEQRLAMLCEGLPFSVVSKIPALPAEIAEREVGPWIEATILRSLQRLGGRLSVLLFHRADDLLGDRGDAAWRAASDLLPPNVRLGVSGYSPDDVAAVCRRFPVSVAQLPGSAIDQRLNGAAGLSYLRGLEIHLRTVFLQGLLLMDSAVAARRVPGCGGALSRWQDWCRHRGIDRATAALAIARGLPGVGFCVIGMDSSAQAEEIVRAWSAAAPMSVPELASVDIDVIDPRRWASA